MTRAGCACLALVPTTPAQAFLMRPGGYIFTDYARIGVILAILVVTTAAVTTATMYG